MPQGDDGYWVIPSFDESLRPRSLRCFVQSVTRLPRVVASAPAALRDYAAATSMLRIGVLRNFLHQVIRFHATTTTLVTKQRRTTMWRFLKNSSGRWNPQFYHLYYIIQAIFKHFLCPWYICFYRGISKTYINISSPNGDIRIL